MVGDFYYMISEKDLQDIIKRLEFELKITYTLIKTRVDSNHYKDSKFIINEYGNEPSVTYQFEADERGLNLTFTWVDPPSQLKGGWVIALVVCGCAVVIIVTILVTIYMYRASVKRLKAKGKQVESEETLETKK